MKTRKLETFRSKRGQQLPKSLYSKAPPPFRFRAHDPVAALLRAVAARQTQSERQATLNPEP
jgi:hypothetical protein